MDLELKGKNALVMASSQGLGRAIAEQLVREGVNVMIASRDEEKLKKVSRELSAIGAGEAAYIKADVTRTEDINSAVQKAVDQFGGFDILVNNAGGPPSGSFLDTSDEDWHHAFTLNLLSYVRLIRQAIPVMEKRGGGRIINIASSSIKQPIPNLVLSNTFRLGIVGLTKTLAEELAPKNILIHTVAPGRIDTDRVEYLDRARAEQTGQSFEEVRQQAEASIPLGRYGQPDELAKVVAFLVSGACTYMTGSSILVDGGSITSI
ncbi:3-oxoacyl-[acyl-carrier protein] reductase [Scopulibacillus daqui]|uniref:3-oxoacyl-[acyl-carrier protein] reductase n=1 Tax=Scopulibacillus daqui TaxID=1469162 RepID=A0ABS2Q2B0_9BACL|nr:3-oxoacyl-[acyl-carrier protein] reductase [Scopulibacillus daqui]